MPTDRSLYPSDWRDIVAAVRARSGGRCECIGECGLHDGKAISPTCMASSLGHPERDGRGDSTPCEWGRVCACACHGDPTSRVYDRRCIEVDGRAAVWAKGKVVLTTAHLCHDPRCPDLSHLRHMCNRCHLRYDSKLHAQHAGETRARKRSEELERAGQGRIL